MFIILFYGLVVLGVITTIFAIMIDSKAYWLAGLFLYIASFLGAFSIGLYLLVLPFIFWTMAIAHSFHRIKKPWHYLLFITVGICLWAISIATLDDYWLFYIDPAYHTAVIGRVSRNLQHCQSSGRAGMSDSSAWIFATRQRSGNSGAAFGPCPVC